MGWQTTQTHTRHTYTHTHTTHTFPTIHIHTHTPGTASSGDDQTGWHDGRVHTYIAQVVEQSSGRIARINDGDGGPGAGGAEGLGSGLW